MSNRPSGERTRGTDRGIDRVRGAGARPRWVLRSRWFAVVRWCVDTAESIAFAGGWAASLAHRLGLQGRLIASSHDIQVRGPPGLPRPLRVAFASDFHAGPLTDGRLLRDAFQRIQCFEPDVVLLGGDFVGLHSRHAGELCEILRSLAPPFGMFAVLGNHDLWKGEAAISRALKDVGVTILKNAAVRLAPPFDSVWIGGLDDPVVGYPDPDATFGQQDGIRVAMIHSPEAIHLLQQKSVAVVFAGHTHGGQVCLPGGRALLLPSRCRKWKSGWYEVDGIPGGMIVSRGVGCSTLPLRVACPPEVHLCALTVG
jgi:predicted MPP superfamily phosphohydrolase